MTPVDRRARHGRDRWPSSAPGKMGLPLAAQFASHGWRVIAVDIERRPSSSRSTRPSHVGEEPGLTELVAEAHAAGRLRATTDGAGAAARRTSSS